MRAMKPTSLHGGMVLRLGANHACGRCPGEKLIDLGNPREQAIAFRCQLGHVVGVVFLGDDFDLGLVWRPRFHLLGVNYPELSATTIVSGAVGR